MTSVLAMKPFSLQQPTLEPLSGLRQQAFQLKPFSRRKFDFIWHLHPEFELTLIQRGYGVRYVGSSIQPFYEGDLCLLGGHLPHAYGSDPRHTATCRWTVLHFLPDAWGQAFWQFSENRKVAALLRASRQGLRFPARTVGHVEKKLITLQALPATDAARILLFLEILHQLSTLPGREVIDPSARVSDQAESIDPRLGLVLQWLEQHAAEDIAQEDVARLIGLSSAAFSRFFHQKTGRLFSRHLNELRTARARAGLLTTDKSVAEIAFESGFNNLANFNRRFVEITGLTPREYRRLSARQLTPPRQSK